MLDRNLITRLKSLVIGALILVMVVGGTTVAFTSRYILWGHSDFGVPDTGPSYDWLGIFVVVPFVIGVALLMAFVKSWLDDRVTKTNHRLL